MNKSGKDIPKSKLEELRGHNSDLLKRLDAFLPQMASANQNLENDVKDDKEVRIDLVMKEDGDEASEENSYSEDGSLQSDGGNDADQSKRVIQMTVALGNLDENDPVINMLSNDKDSIDSDEDHAHDKEQEEASDDCVKEKDTDVIRGMLQDRGRHQDQSPLFTVRSTKRK
jgi:hypothetical protein